VRTVSAHDVNGLRQDLEEAHDYVACGSACSQDQNPLVAQLDTILMDPLEKPQAVRRVTLPTMRFPSKCVDRPGRFGLPRDAAPSPTPRLRQPKRLLFVWRGEIQPAHACSVEPVQRLLQCMSLNSKGHVDGVDPKCTKRGVMNQGREGVVDRVAENRVDLGRSIHAVRTGVGQTVGSCRAGETLALFNSASLSCTLGTTGITVPACRSLRSMKIAASTSTTLNTWFTLKANGPTFPR
jgi:hypothetical protein